MKLHDARVLAMQILYTADLNSNTIDEVLLSYNDVDPKALEFVNLVTTNLEKIDFVISVCLKNYTINRLNLVDKAIVRLATAELIEGKTDKRIVINEAIELTKEFSDQGDHKAASFNNRLLDNISVRVKDLI
ncbi:MAG: transcription antitermination factor NusB [Acholeplasmatales bacterium]|nr:transcription antitermination factor NusB [Acholeplasmatales bacterium]